MGAGGPDITSKEFTAKCIKIKHFFESIPSFAVDYHTESWGATSITKAATQYLLQMKSSGCLCNIEILVDAIDEVQRWDCWWETRGTKNC